MLNLQPAQDLQVRAILTKAKEEIQIIVGEPIGLELSLLPVSVKDDQLIKVLKLKKAIQDVSGEKWSDIISKSRVKELAYARHLFAYHARAFTTLSLKAIGEVLGGRDHTTPINSIQAVKDLLDAKDEMMTKMNNHLTQILYNDTEAES